MEEDVAIVGVGCRFPGGEGLEGFWGVLEEGRDCLTDIPKERWSLEAYYSPDGDTRGKTYVRQAGFIPDHDAWDNRMFGVSDVEAASMDPQQQMVVECSYRAMENAGVTRQQMRGSNTGVYIGAMNSDYQNLYGLESETTNYTLTGTSASNVAARVSYVFDLRGNSLVVNTACSSSLQALHLGCQALRAGEVEMALCGGVNSLLEPGTFLQLSRARMASPSSRCQAFSAKADGYARGEGCGMLLLKRLSQAIAAGDPIWAVVHSGTNQDGRTVSPMTAPSWKQQKELLQEVFRRSGLDPARVQYIEAHGTGTKAGDPVEVRSLGEFFLEVDKARRGNSSSGEGETVEEEEGRGHVRQRWMGSVKTNIGHLESAAGVAGVIKVLLMMRHNKMPPSLHFDEPNPRIDFQAYALNVVTQTRDWSQPIKMACVNSFSFGGTNGHVVLTSPPALQSSKARPKEKEESRSYVVCFSGGSRDSLVGSVEDFAQKVERDTYSLRDVAFTSCCRRDLYSWRLAVLGESLPEVVEKARAALIQEEELEKTEAASPHLVLVFCGMGTAWRGMGREMMACYPHFRHTIQDIDSDLKSYVPWSLADRLMASDDVTDPLFGPIGIFACQVALARLWESWGVRPDVIVGQSVGEVAAACVAGVLDLGQAVKVIYHRSAVLAKARGGKMLIIGNYDVSKVEQLCKRYKGRVNVALYCSPQSCSISGDGDAVDAIHSHLQSLAPRSEAEKKEETILLRPLAVSCAYHSHQMAPCGAQLTQHLTSLVRSPPKVPIVSCVTGQPVVSPGDFGSGPYWAASVLQPCLFYQALKQSLEAGRLDVCVEVGPTAVLPAHLKHVQEDVEAGTGARMLAMPSMLRNQERRCFLLTAARLHQLGLTLDWRQAFPSFQGAQVTDIPRYAFSRVQQLVVPEDARQKLEGSLLKAGDLRLVRSTLGRPASHLRAFIEPNSLASVYTHRFQGAILLPGALYVELALEAASLQDPTSHFCLAVSARFRDALAMSKNETVSLDIITTPPASPDPNGKQDQSFVIKRQNKVHAEGRIWRIEGGSPPTFDLPSIHRRCERTFTAAQKYSRLEGMGFSYGDLLKVSGDSRYNTRECLMEVKSPQAGLLEEMHNVLVHPALLDSIFQATVPLMDPQDLRPSLPVGVGAVVLWRPPGEGSQVYCYRGQQSPALALHHAFLLDDQGHVVMEVHNFAVQFLGVETVERLAFLPSWKPMDIQTPKLKTREEESFWRTTLLITDMACSAPNVISPRSFHSEEALRKKLKNQISPEHSRVVFLATEMHSTTPETTKGSEKQGLALYEKTVSCCNTLRVLVLILRTQMRELPLFVVSHRAWVEDVSGVKTSTMAGDSSHQRESVNSLPGAALWGMVRNLLREGVYPHLRLVDLHVANDDIITCLPSALSAASSPPLDEMSEMIWSADGMASVNEVERLEVRGLKNHRRQTWDDKMRAVLVVSREEASRESLLLQVVPERRGRNKADLKKSVSGGAAKDPGKLFHEGMMKKPEKVFHNGKMKDHSDKHVTNILIGKGGAGKIWKQNHTATPALEKSSCHLVDIQVLEVTIAAATSRKEETLATDHVPDEMTPDPVMVHEVSGVTQQGERVVAAWPVEAATRVRVPAVCCLPTSLLPGYFPGLLNRLLLLHALSSRIGRQPGTVGLLADDLTSTDAGLLSAMLRAQGNTICIQLVSAKKGGPTDRLLQCHVLVSLVRLSPGLSTTLCREATALGELVLHEALLPSKSLALLCRTSSGLRISQVTEAELTSPDFLQAAVPALACWLKSSDPNVLFSSLTKSGFPSTAALPNRRNWSTSSQSGHTPSNVRDLTSVRGVKLDGGGMEVLAGRECLLRGDGVYLVVGGLTGLGWECVRHLAGRGAGGLVLLGRRKAEKARLRELEALEREHGCRTHCVQADMCSLSSLQQAFSQVRSLFPGWPIKGVFFGAAVLEDALFERMTLEQYRKVLQPKVLGLWNIHLATLSEPLDYFVVHSSVTGVLGNPGQTNYAAANAFMDALVAWRCGQGLAGTALSWGPLDLGLLKDKTSSVPRLLEAQGFSILGVEEVGACLDLALMREEHHLMLLKLDKDRLATALHREGNRSLIRRLHPILGRGRMAEAAGGGVEAGTGGEKGQASRLDVQAVTSLSRAERLSALQRYLVTVVGSVFGVEEVSLTPDTAILDLGVDSMLAMALVNLVAQDTGCRLSVVPLLQEGSSLRSLALELDALLLQTGEGRGDGSSAQEGKSSNSGEGEGKEGEGEGEGEEDTTLSAYEMRQYQSGLTIKVELELGGLRDLGTTEEIGRVLREAALTSVSRHPLLHSSCLESKGGQGGTTVVRRHQLPVEESLDWRQLGDVREAAWGKRLAAWTQEPLLLSSRGPLRFLMLGGPEPKLILVLSCIVFDHVSTMLFLQDFRQLSYAIGRQRAPPLPSPPYDASINVKAEVERALKPRRQEMRRFWKTVVDQPVSRASLADLTPKGGKSGECVLLDGPPLSPSLVSRLQDVASELGASLFQVLAAVYHTLLTLATGHLTTSLTVYVTARASLPSLARALGNTTNVIPLVTTVQKGYTLAELTRLVAKDFRACLDHALLPTLEIQGMVPSQDQRDNLFRHGLVMLTAEDQKSKEVTGSAFTHQGRSRETFLQVEMIQHDLAGASDASISSSSNSSSRVELRLTLGYQSHLLSQRRAKAVLSGLQCLLEELAFGSGETLAALSQRPFAKALLTQQ